MSSGEIAAHAARTVGALLDCPDGSVRAILVAVVDGLADGLAIFGAGETVADRRRSCRATLRLLGERMPTVAGDALLACAIAVPRGCRGERWDDIAWCAVVVVSQPAPRAPRIGQAPAVARLRCFDAFHAGAQWGGWDAIDQAAEATGNLLAWAEGVGLAVDHPPTIRGVLEAMPIRRRFRRVKIGKAQIRGSRESERAAADRRAAQLEADRTTGALLAMGLSGEQVRAILGLANDPERMAQLLASVSATVAA